MGLKTFVTLFLGVEFYLARKLGLFHGSAPKMIVCGDLNQWEVFTEFFGANKIFILFFGEGGCVNRFIYQGFL